MNPRSLKPAPDERERAPRRSRQRRFPFWQLPAALLLLIVVAFVTLSGDRIGFLLHAYLRHLTGLESRSGSIEYSLAYPGVIKIQDLRLGEGEIRELYVDFAPLSLLFGDELEISDLFVRGVRLGDKERQALNRTAAGFKAVAVTRARIEEVPLNAGELSLDEASLSLSGLRAAPEGAWQMDEGVLSARGGSFAGLNLGGLQAAFKPTGTGYEISDLTVELLGGMLNGSLSYDVPARTLRFSALKARGLILKEGVALPEGLSLEAGSADLEQLTAVLPQSGLLLSGVSGELRGLRARQGHFAASFEGSISEITLPKNLMTLEDNRVTGIITPALLSVRARGRAFEGRYALEGDADLNAHKLMVRELKLEDMELEADARLQRGLAELLAYGTLDLRQVTLTRINLLSRLKGLPLSARSLNLSLNGLKLARDFTVEDKSAFMMKLDATGVTLADLLLSGVRAQLSISGDLLSFSIPELRLRHSAVSLDATYNLKNGQGLMNFAAPDFEISELNSTLIPRLMHGRLSAQAELRAAPGENPPWERLTGTVSLSGSELIIAQLGLDLINGGSADTRNLSFDELIDGLRGADLGAREARLEANFTPAQVNASAEMNLSTARLKAQLRADLRKFTLKGHLNLMSLPRDSSTLVTVSGPLEALRFAIEPLSRGEMRPGLYSEEIPELHLIEARPVLPPGAAPAPEAPGASPDSSAAEKKPAQPAPPAADAAP